MTRSRTFAAALALSLVPLLAWQAEAWACVPVPLVSVLPRSSGPAGSAVTVQGENFPGPVEIRWDSLEGPLLGTAQDATVPSTVRVPSVPGGLYLLIMLTRQPDRTVGVVGRAPFLVEGASPTGTQIGSPASGSHGSSSHAWAIAVAALALMGLWGAVLLRRRPRRDHGETPQHPDESEDEEVNGTQRHPNGTSQLVSSARAAPSGRPDRGG